MDENHRARGGYRGCGGPNSHAQSRSSPARPTLGDTAQGRTKGPMIGPYNHSFPTHLNKSSMFSGSNKRTRRFEPYLSLPEMTLLLQNATLLLGLIRVNPSRQSQAYAAIAALPFDIFIGTIIATPYIHSHIFIYNSLISLFLKLIYNTL